MNTDCIVMAVDFESAVVHLVNCLPEVRVTCRNSSVESDLEIKVKNQER